MVHASLRLPGVPARPMNPALVPALSCRAETEMFSPGVIYIRRIRRGCNSQQRADLLAAENSILYYRFRVAVGDRSDRGIDSRERVRKIRGCLFHASSRLEGEFRVARLLTPRDLSRLLSRRCDIFSSLPSPGSVNNLSAGFEAREGSIHLPFRIRSRLMRH